MKDVLVFFSTVLLTVSVGAQNIINVRPAHSMKAVYTLNDREGFLYGESWLGFQSNQMQYSFRIRKGNEFKTVYNDRETEFVDWNNLYIYDDSNSGYGHLRIQNGKRNIYSKSGKMLDRDVDVYREVNNSRKTKSSGYIFSPKGKSLFYYRDARKNKKYGPFYTYPAVYKMKDDQLVIFSNTSDGRRVVVTNESIDTVATYKIDFTHLTEEGIYNVGYTIFDSNAADVGTIFINGMMVGRYANIRYNYAGLHYEIRNKVGRSIKYITTDGEVVENSENEITKLFYYYSDSKKWVKVSYAVSDNGVLSHAQKNRIPVYITSNAFKDKIGPCSMSYQSTWSFGKERNVINYAIPSEYNYSIDEAGKFTFKKNDSVNYYVRDLKGKLLGVFKNKIENPSFKLKGDLYFQIGNNVYKNGELTYYSHSEHGYGYSKLVQENELDSVVELYTKNNQKMELPIAMKRSHLEYSGDDPVVIYKNKVGEKKIYFPQTQTESIPLNWISEIQLGRAKNDYALLSSGIVVINNEEFGRGFDLKYNAKDNSYHWFSIDDRKVILHSFELD